MKPTLKQLVEIFGKQPLVDQILRLRQKLNYLEGRKRYFQELSRTCDRTLDWFYAWRIEDTEEVISKTEKRIKRHQFAISDTVFTNTVDIEDIKAIPIKEVVELYITPNNTGLNSYKAPWRNERTASLHIYPKTNSWYDFGEGVGGSNIDFIMKLNDCTIKEAINILKGLL